MNYHQKSITDVQSIIILKRHRLSLIIIDHSPGISIVFVSVPCVPSRGLTKGSHCRAEQLSGSGGLAARSAGLGLLGCCGMVGERWFMKG